MSKATQTLPPGYARAREVDLTKDKTMESFVLFTWLITFCPLWFGLTHLARQVRSQIQLETNLVPENYSFELYIVGYLILFLGMFAWHELVHAFFFWLYTRSWPVFGITPGYLYVAAPSWYLQPGQYLIISLAPLLIVTSLFFLLALFMPEGWMAAVSLLAVGNLLGSLGDLWISFQLLLSDPGCLVNDRGHAVYFYESRF
jgi:hypothetical protein